MMALLSNQQLLPQGGETGWGSPLACEAYRNQVIKEGKQCTQIERICGDKLARQY